MLKRGVICLFAFLFILVSFLSICSAVDEECQAESFSSYSSSGISTFGNCGTSIISSFDEVNDIYSERYKVTAAGKIYSWEVKTKLDSEGYVNEEQTPFKVTSLSLDSEKRISEVTDTIGTTSLVTKYQYSDSSDDKKVVTTTWADGVTTEATINPETCSISSFGELNSYRDFSVDPPEEHFDKTYNADGDVTRACLKTDSTFCVDFTYSQFVPGRVVEENWPGIKIVPIYLADGRIVASEIYESSGATTTGMTGAVIGVGKSIWNSITGWVTGSIGSSYPGWELYDVEVYSQPGVNDESGAVSLEEMADYGISVSTDINRCGNGIWEPNNGEECDDGTGGGDGCNGACLIEHMCEDTIPLTKYDSLINIIDGGLSENMDLVRDNKLSLEARWASNSSGFICPSETPIWQGTTCFVDNYKLTESALFPDNSECNYTIDESAFEIPYNGNLSDAINSAGSQIKAILNVTSCPNECPEKKVAVGVSSILNQTINFDYRISCAAVNTQQNKLESYFYGDKYCGTR